MSDHPWAWRFSFFTFFILTWLGSKVDWENGSLASLLVLLLWIGTSLLILAIWDDEEEDFTYEVHEVASIWLKTIALVAIGKGILILSDYPQPLWIILGVITVILWSTATFSLRRPLIVKECNEGTELNQEVFPNNF